MSQARYHPASPVLAAPPVQVANLGGATDADAAVRAVPVSLRQGSRGGPAAAPGQSLARQRRPVARRSVLQGGNERTNEVPSASDEVTLMSPPWP